MRIHPILILSAALASHALAATLTVSKDGRGDFATIQAAVDHSRPYDMVTILDTATYPEQVTIRAPLHHFTLRSANPAAARKPVIRWSDNVNVGPTTCAQALDTAKITFDRNGVLRLIDARDIHVDGIALDGAGATPFAWPSIWGDGVTCTGQLYPLFHGNVGLLLFRSSQAIVTGCDIANAYFGVYIKEHDPRGPFLVRTISHSGGAQPFARMALGNHWLEGNSIHHNTWGVFVESAWGLGSEFRDNLIFENHHATPAAAAAVKAMSSEGANQPGGAFFFKDAQLSAMTLRNNSLWHNFLVLAGGYRGGAQHLIVNNIFASPYEPWSRDLSFPSSFMALDPYFPKRMKFNAYAAQTDLTPLDSVLATASLIDSATGQQVDGSKSFYGSKNVRIMNGFPPPNKDSVGLVAVPLSGGARQVAVPLPPAVYAGAILAGGTAPFDFAAADQNRWLETRFLSTVPADSDFLRPDPGSQEFLRPDWSPLRYSGVSAADSRLGAHPFAARPRGILRLTPLAPVRVDSGQMVLRFSVLEANGGTASSADAPLISYLRLERNVPINPNSFGGTASLQLPEAEPISPPVTPLHYGFNEIKLPASGLSADSNGFGFVEMAVQGMGPDLRGMVSNVAGFPIIPSTSLFTVEAVDDSTGVRISGIAPGKTFRLRVAYVKPPAQMNPVSLSTATGAALKFEPSPNVDSAGNILTALPVLIRVQFTETPDAGVDWICAAAYADTLRQMTGYGQSQAISVFGTPVSLAHPKKIPPVMPMDILKGRNFMGRKIPTRGFRID